MKRQPTKWEKIFANHIIAKGLIIKICQELTQFSSKKKKKKKATQFKYEQI